MSKHDFVAVVQDIYGAIEARKPRGIIQIVLEKPNKILPQVLTYEGELDKFFPYTSVKRLKLSGEYIDGDFILKKVSDASVVKNKDNERLIQYIVSGKVPCMSVFLGEGLYKKFGNALIVMLEQMDTRLIDFQDINVAKLNAICRAWNEILHHRNTFEILYNSGLKSSAIEKIFLTYKNSLRKIQEILDINPYLLYSEDVLTFHDCDLLGQELEISENDIRRLFAFLQAMTEKSAEMTGSTRIETSTLNLALKENDEEKLRKIVFYPRTRRINSSKLFEAYPKAIEERVLVEVEHFVYGFKAFKNEIILADRIRKINAENLGKIKLPASFDFSRSLSMDGSIIQLEEAQQKALKVLAEGASIMTLTGGPGTGKTTTINAMISMALMAGFQKNEIILAAPTGKAAKRMQEATGFPSSTIHRLLRLKDENSFAQKIEAKLLFIDETSMLDNAVAKKLFTAIPNGCRVVLIGDPDQLPSVAAGNVLFDMTCSKFIPTVTLSVVRRQAKTSLIPQNAEAIRLRNPSGVILPKYGKSELDMVIQSFDQPYMWISDPIVKRQKTEERGKDGIEKIKKIIFDCFAKGYEAKDILCLTRVKKEGQILNVAELNYHLREIFNPKGQTIVEDSKTFSGKILPGLRMGDTVIQLENDYNHDVYNGDIGKIVGFNPKTNALIVDFEESDGSSKLITFFPKEKKGPLKFQNFELAYALTVHKSQGSESKVVIYVCPAEHNWYANSNLFYTGSTRAQELCIIVGDEKSIREMVKKGPERRQTGLTGFIDDETKYHSGMHRLMESLSPFEKRSYKKVSFKDENVDLEETGLQYE